MSDQSRRSFIRTAALGAAAATALPSLLRAQSSSSESGSPSPAAGALPSLSPLVDWHSHIVTPGELRYLAGRSAAPRVITDSSGATLFENLTTVSAEVHKPGPISPSDIPSRLKHLDASGVKRQLLTYTVANGYDATLPVEELRVFFRTLNDDLAAVVRQNPGRFIGVAAVPTTDTAWAVQELERAHKELGLIGIALPLNAVATLEGARTLAPIFTAGQKHRSHFFFHRAPASNNVPGQPPLIVPTDTESVRWSVISNTHLVNGAITLGLTDFLDPYPDITVQVIMLGGFLPYLLESIIHGGRRSGIKDPLAKLRRLYLEPGPYSGSNGDWVALAAAKLGADRILFGTDYGVGGGTNTDRLAPAIANLDKYLSADVRQKIYIDNSVTLLKAKGITV